MTRILITVMLVSLFPLFSPAESELYYFHGIVKEVKTGPPYPINGFRCKISIQRHYSGLPRYLAYPLVEDQDSRWMCKLVKNTHVEVLVKRKMGKDGNWQDKGKVIMMEVLDDYVSNSATIDQ